MADTLYVNKPGGIIVPTEEGHKTLAYGDPVPSNISAGVDPSGWADGKPRVAGSDLQLEAAAHARAALSEDGQINSGSSPVPGNYNELAEDAAALLVAHLERYPESQATVLKHEILYGGNRQKVVDAASQRAQISAHAQIASEVVGVANDQRDAPRAVPLGDPQIAPGDPARTEQLLDAPLEVELPPPASSEGHAAGVTGEPNRFDSLGLDSDLSPDDRVFLERALAKRRGSSTKTTGEPATEFDGDGVTVEKLDAYAEQHNVEGYPKSGNKEEKVDFLKAEHGSPQTPIE